MLRRLPILALGAGCVAAPAGSLILEPDQALPTNFEDVGLYPRAPNFDLVPPEALAYAPAWPLWSNGSSKDRYVVTPDGELPPAGGPYADGTLFFKTFFYGDGGAREPVETRAMRWRGGLWEFAVWLWNDSGTRAVLGSMEEPVEVAVGDVVHTVPSRFDCRSCHESGAGPVLGYSPLQLGEESVRANGAPVEVLGWFEGNCTHCHHGEGGGSSSFDLRHDVAAANTVGVDTASSASAAGVRVVPGDPGASLLFQAVSGETDDPDVLPMPPVGVDVRDTVAIEAIRTWIEGLDAR